jgi:hypothetical protein
MDCENCSKTRAPEPVPYVVHESDMARLERTIKRLWILLLVLIVLFVGSNGWWIWRESQFEDITITQENEDGYNNFIGNDGDIYNGEANNQNSQEEDGR